MSSYVQIFRTYEISGITENEDVDEISGITENEDDGEISEITENQHVGEMSEITEKPVFSDNQNMRIAPLIRRKTAHLAISRVQFVCNKKKRLGIIGFLSN